MAKRFEKICITAVNAAYSHSSLSVRCLSKMIDNAVIREYTINDNVSETAANLYKENCDLYAFSCYIWNIEFILDVCRILKEAKDSVIILGGPEASYDGAKVLKEYPFIDFVMQGEGDIALKDFVCGKEFEDICGLVYRSEEKIVDNGMAFVCDLDILPRLYTKKDIALLENKIIYYETSRGCPFRCSYCLSSTSHGVRYFSLKRVLDDFYMFMKCGVKLVKLVDRTFNSDQKRTAKILRFILEHNKSTCFHFEITADILSDELIELLTSAPKGFFQLEIGVQSTNSKTLEAIDRKSDTDRLFSNVIKLREKNNMHMHLDLIAGLPCESYNRFKKSFDDIYMLEPDMLQMGFLKLLKGTKIRTEAEKYAYRFNPKPPYEVISNDFISYKELLELKEVCNMVEKYYNSHAFEKAVEYVSSMYESVFDFFHDLAFFWERKGCSKQPQSRQKLYEIFIDFHKEKINGDNSLFSDLLKFDFVKNNKNIPLPSWAQRSGDKNFYKSVYDFLLSDGGKKYICRHESEKKNELMRTFRVEKFNFDVLETQNFGECVIIFDYEKKSCKKIEGKF